MSFYASGLDGDGVVPGTAESCIGIAKVVAQNADRRGDAEHRTFGDKRNKEEYKC
jgi:hypothetical protein